MQLLRPVPHAVSQAFGAYPTRGNPHPTFGDYQPFGHLGIDYACPAGTPVRAAHDGVLDWLGWSHHMSAAMQAKWMMGGSDASGVCVHLDAGNGLGTTYNHLLSASVSNIHVKAGQIIGYSGATGRSAGDHLHFELVRLPAPNDGIRYGRIDPAPYIVNSLPQAPTSGGTGAPAPTTAPAPKPKEWYEMPLNDETKKEIYQAVWFGAPGAKLIPRRYEKGGEWPEATLGSMTDRIVRQQLAPLRTQVASQDAQIRSLVGAIAALSKGEPFDQAKLLAGVKSSAAAGVKEAVESIETTVNLKGQ